MIGLLDGDIVVFRCGFAAERMVHWLAWDPIYETAPDGTQDKDNPEFRQTKVFEYKREAREHLDKVCPGKKSRVEGQDYMFWAERDLEPLSHALNNVKTLIERVCEATTVDLWDLRVYLSSGENFRHREAKTRPYKGNRIKEHRPTYEKEIRNYLIENYDCYVAEDEEADDLMGIAQTKIGPEKSVIISLDKDLDQIPGLKYNWLHDAHYFVDDKKAAYNFHMQLMSGDTTDNIPGLPGIGPGKAAKALHGAETPEEMMEEVCRMYQMHSGVDDWLEYLREQGRLLYIRRKPGEMWEPPVDLEDPYLLDMNMTLEIG